MVRNLDEQLPRTALVMAATGKDVNTLSLHLRGAGLDVSSSDWQGANTGIYARDTLQKLQGIEVAAVDLDSLGDSGLRVIQQLSQARDEPGGFPKILVLGGRTEGQQDLALRAGCDAFITRPITNDALKQAVKRFAKRTKRGSYRANGRLPLACGLPQGGNCKGRTVNFSLGGLFFEAEREMPAGHNIPMKLAISKTQTINVWFQVLRCIPIDSVRFGARVAGTFLNLSDEDRVAVGRLITHTRRQTLQAQLEQNKDAAGTILGDIVTQEISEWLTFLVSDSGNETPAPPADVPIDLLERHADELLPREESALGLEDGTASEQELRAWIRSWCAVRVYADFLATRGEQAADTEFKGKFIHRAQSFLELVERSLPVWHQHVGRAIDADGSQTLLITMRQIVRVRNAHNQLRDRNSREYFATVAQAEDYFEKSKTQLKPAGFDKLKLPSERELKEKPRISLPKIPRTAILGVALAILAALGFVTGGNSNVMVTADEVSSVSPFLERGMYSEGDSEEIFFGWLDVERWVALPKEQRTAEADRIAKTLSYQQINQSRIYLGDRLAIEIHVGRATVIQR